MCPDHILFKTELPEMSVAERSQVSPFLGTTPAKGDTPSPHMVAQLLALPNPAALTSLWVLFSVQIINNFLQTNLYLRFFFRKPNLRKSQSIYKVSVKFLKETVYLGLQDVFQITKQILIQELVSQNLIFCPTLSKISL